MLSSVLLSSLLCFGAHSADETVDIEDALEILEKQGPAANVFCGVICLTAYANLVGVDVQLEELASDPAFVRPELGSSLAQLEDAAATLGLYAKPVGNITEDFLKQTPYKVILHVRQNADEPFSHYELYLGTRGGNAKLFDAPRPVYESDFKSLRSRMSGKGLLLSTVPLKVQGLSWRKWGAYAVSGLVSVALMLYFLRPGRFRRCGLGGSEENA